MQTNPLIGFCGKMGSGKTTAAKHLCDSLGYRRERLAGPLKDMLRALGLSEAEVDGDRKEVPCDMLGGQTPRHAMITLGTEWGRDLVDPELWVRAWERRVDAHLARNIPVVCDDIRFPNEAKAIRDRGGLIIRIASQVRGSDSDHVSESIPFAWDYVIENDGSLFEFYLSVQSAIMVERIAA